MDSLDATATLKSLLGNFTFPPMNMTDQLYVDVMGFYHAIDWHEWWLLVLAAFHALVWTIVVITRSSDEFQMALLVAIRENMPLIPCS